MSIPSFKNLTIETGLHIKSSWLTNCTYWWVFSLTLCPSRLQRTSKLCVHAPSHYQCGKVVIDKKWYFSFDRNQRPLMPWLALLAWRKPPSHWPSSCGLWSTSLVMFGDSAPSSSSKAPPYSLSNSSIGMSLSAWNSGAQLTKPTESFIWSAPCSDDVFQQFLKYFHMWRNTFITHANVRTNSYIRTDSP